MNEVLLYIAMWLFIGGLGIGLWKLDAFEKHNKNNSANNDSEYKDEDCLDEFFYNRYHR
jgi:hypothetical protein